MERKEQAASKRDKLQQTMESIQSCCFDVNRWNKHRDNGERTALHTTSDLNRIDSKTYCRYALFLREDTANESASHIELALCCSASN